MIYLKLFWEFFKVGLFTFGGGYAMIPIVQESALNNSWLTEDEFLELIGVCESTPGPIAINMATYIGSVQGGLLGSILATLGVVLPSFIIILLIASLLKHITKNLYFQSFLNGVKPIVLALIIFTGLLLTVKCIGYNTDFTFTFSLKNLILFLALSSIYIFNKFVLKKKTNTILLIFISAILGLIVYSI